MKKLLYITTACLFISACGNYNTKQPIDETYYKKTQGIAWPTEQTSNASTVKVTPTQDNTDMK